MARSLSEKPDSSFASSHSFCRRTTIWRGTGLENFEFYIPGLTFKLATNSGIPDKLQQLWPHSWPQGLIIVEMASDSHCGRTATQSSKVLCHSDGRGED
jgi:hypothetical protein